MLIRFAFESIIVNRNLTLITLKNKYTNHQDTPHTKHHKTTNVFRHKQIFGKNSDEGMAVSETQASMELQL